MTADESLRRHLIDSIAGGHAHAPFERAVRDWPAEARGVKPPGFQHTAWELVEHLRIAQWDILEFSRRADHVSPDFPAGYWPDRDEPPDDRAWEESIARFQEDLEAMQSLVADPAIDLDTRIPHGDGQTILREALTLAAHNSYHIGQLMALRRALGA